MPGMLSQIMALAVLLALTFPVCGQAAEKFAPNGNPYFEKIFLETARADCPWPEEEVRLVNFNLRPQYPDLPPEPFGLRITQKPADCRPGKKVMAAAIIKNGQEYGQVKMNGDLRLFGPVLIVNKRLGRNEIIGNEDLAVTHRDVTMLDPGFLKSKEQAAGRRLKVSLPSGAILRAQALSEPDLVRRGEKVTILAKSELVQISVPGEAKDSGARGEIIRIKNLSSRREIQAKVVDSGLVETEF